MRSFKNKAKIPPKGEIVEKKTSVSQIVEAAKNMDSQPVYKNLENVLNKFEKTLLQEGQEYEKLEEIYMLAISDLEDKESLKNQAPIVLLAINILNIARRIKNRSEEQIKSAFLAVKDGINTLGGGLYKKRCLELWFYNFSVFSAKIGDYKKAYQLQNGAAKYAETKEKKSISAYMTLVYKMWNSVMRLEMDEAKKLLTEISIQLNMFYEDGVVEKRWLYGNGPIHLLQAYILMDEKDLFWREHLNKVLQAGLSKDFSKTIEMLRIANFERRGSHDKALIESVKFFINNGKETSASAFVLLTTARIYKKIGNKHESRSIYTELVENPRTDALMVSSVAKYELEVLEHPPIIK